MSVAPVFTESEFALLEEALTDLKKSAEKASRCKVELEDITGSSSNSGFGAFIGAHLKKLAEEKFKEHAAKGDGIVILQAKLIEYKRWQRQQNAQPTNTASA